MKIRIKGNSIRIRLSKSEVDTFGHEGYLEEKTEFAGGRSFVYALSKYHTHVSISADLTHDKITMLVPASRAEEWVTTDLVGLSDNMDVGEGKTLFLLLEKDFKCIDNEVTEDQSDNFDNPLHTCA